MKKLLLFLLVAVCIGCDKEDPEPVDETKPKVVDVEFMQVQSGGEPRVRVLLTLSIPEAGSVKSVSYVRNLTARVNNVIINPVDGPSNTFVDNSGLWPNGEMYYRFILVLQDDTEIVSDPYKVQ